KLRHSPASAGKISAHPGGGENLAISKLLYQKLCRLPGIFKSPEAVNFILLRGSDNAILHNISINRA
ncbi:MAG: hypothetical protein RR060_04135, partial [Victivallaceae bacterium]